MWRNRRSAASQSFTRRPPTVLVAVRGLSTAVYLLRCSLRYPYRLDLQFNVDDIHAFRLLDKYHWATSCGRCRHLPVLRVGIPLSSTNVLFLLQLLLESDIRTCSYPCRYGMNVARACFTMPVCVQCTDVVSFPSLPALREQDTLAGAQNPSWEMNGTCFVLRCGEYLVSVAKQLDSKSSRSVRTWQLSFGGAESESQLASLTTGQTGHPFGGVAQLGTPCENVLSRIAHRPLRRMAARYPSKPLSAIKLPQNTFGA